MGGGSILLCSRPSQDAIHTTPDVVGGEQFVADHGSFDGSLWDRAMAFLIGAAACAPMNLDPLAPVAMV